MVYKDACNRKSNQQNLGTIKSSNLCTEIVEYTSPDEVSLQDVITPWETFSKLLRNTPYSFHTSQAKTIANVFSRKSFILVYALRFFYLVGHNAFSCQGSLFDLIS